MKVAVDISLYPLADDIIPPIKDVIARLNSYESLDVQTNRMSTQVRGDYADVMSALNKEIGATFEQNDRAIFVIKIINNPL